MPDRTSYAPGTPSWVDIGTDVDAAIPFYTGLFGWEVDGGSEEMGGYGFWKLDGKVVGGFGPAQNPGPPVWSTYITVADVEASSEVVTAAGGTIVVPAMDVMTAGRMAVCQDPQGGFFSMWQPGETAGSEVVNEPGAFCWNELNSRDVAGSIAFYEAVFGWTANTTEIPDGPISSYTQFELDGQTIGGMLPMPPMVPAQVPTFWLVYFAVDDCDASLAKAQELGGSVVMPPMEVVAGRFSVLTDPQGGTFAIIKLSGEM